MCFRERVNQGSKRHSLAQDEHSRTIGIHVCYICIFPQHFSIAISDQIFVDLSDEFLIPVMQVWTSELNLSKHFTFGECVIENEYLHIPIQGETSRKKLSMGILSGWDKKAGWPLWGYWMYRKICTSFFLLCGSKVKSPRDLTARDLSSLHGAGFPFLTASVSSVAEI